MLALAECERPVHADSLDALLVLGESHALVDVDALTDVHALV